MNAPAKLLVWTGAQSACIRVSGRATFAVSVDFRRLLQRLRQTPFTRILLDLSQCQAMDSTFLGVLAHEASQFANQSAPNATSQIVLLNTPDSMHETIEDLGVATLFQFLNRKLDADGFEPVAGTSPASRTELTRTSLEAHEALMALDPANVARFKDVRRFLAGELEGTPGPSTDPPAQV